jgi:hypothetical protein
MGKKITAENMGNKQKNAGKPYSPEVVFWA